MLLFAALKTAVMIILGILLFILTILLLVLFVPVRYSLCADASSEKKRFGKSAVLMPFESRAFKYSKDTEKLWK